MKKNLPFCYGDKENESMICPDCMEELKEVKAGTYRCQRCKRELLTNGSSTTLKICEIKVHFYKHCLILAEDLFSESEPNKNTPGISDQRRRKLYGSIVFLAFALESFINEIGIEYCSSKDFEAIDRITTPEKWIIIPKLCSKDILERGKEPHQSIAMIFKYRDRFAHFKPELKRFDNKDYKMMRQVDHDLIRKFYDNSLEAMKKVRDEFNIPEMEWLDDKVLI